MWEYLVVFISDSDTAKDDVELDSHLDADRFTEKLNKYGEAGWELVSFDWKEDGARAAFKRRKNA